MSHFHSHQQNRSMYERPSGFTASIQVNEKKLKSLLKKMNEALFRKNQVSQQNAISLPLKLRCRRSFRLLTNVRFRRHMLAVNVHDPKRSLCFPASGVPGRADVFNQSAFLRCLHSQAPPSAELFCMKAIHLKKQVFPDSSHSILLLNIL